MNGTLNETDVFLAAIEVDDPKSRDAYLDVACAGDDKFRQRVEALVRQHLESQGVLDEPPPGLVATTELSTIAEGPGTIIGPYKLLEQIGEGGMGVVFMAEQTHPVRRRVALKIIKPGMDTRQVIARFEAERQALALMDHPNIARVLDAGATETGRPYFVMDLVKGVPVTDYCDQQRLSVRQRLELFTQVCHAVQHAHQKGIIHRDLKPSNVLVPEYDGKPVPKVIDFGVAKATAQQLTERTMFTQFGQLIGTFEYMSPEQARFNQLDVDTRSDIYSLGVLLYELLAGSTPLEKERLRAAAFDEILRLISDEDPPRPSTRISSSQALPTIAANRNLEPKKLTGVVSGELDWIAMKCLEKDRNRRYDTASGLGRDIERYLLDEPVQACPPSAAYRFRKFAQRNKVALFLTSAAVAALLLLVVGLAVSNRLIAAANKQVAAERDQKTIALREKESALRQAEAERRRAEDKFEKARTAVSSILSKAATGQQVWWQLTPEMRKVFANEAVKFYESLLQEDSADPSLQFETAVGYRSLGELHHLSGEYEQGEKLLRKSLGILEPLSIKFPRRAEYRRQVAYNNFLLGSALNRLKQPAEAEAAYQKSIALIEQVCLELPDVPDCFTQWFLTFRGLVQMQSGQGRLDDVQRTWQRASGFLERIPPTLMTLDIALSIGTVLWRADLRDEAAAVWQNAISQDPGDFDNCNTLAWFLATTPALDLRDPQRAVKLALKAVEVEPDEGALWNTLGIAQYRAGDIEKSIESLRKSMELSNGGDCNDWFFLAMAEWRQGNEIAAREWYDKAAKWMNDKLPHATELMRFREEAAELLGVVEPKADPSTAPPATESRP